jgi:hypothetical protein
MGPGRCRPIEHGHLRLSELGEHVKQCGANTAGATRDDDPPARIAQRVRHAGVVTQSVAGAIVYVEMSALMNSSS